jgi:hypothetical protein
MANKQSKNEISAFDSLYHYSKTKKISAEMYFTFLELYWPTFILHKDYVFLEEQFSEAEFKRLSVQNEKIEYWMNFLLVTPFFEEEDEWEEKAQFLSKELVDIWQAKLDKEFPDLNIFVTYLEDTEVGDYGLTFYQKKYK